MKMITKGFQIYDKDVMNNYIYEVNRYVDSHFYSFDIQFIYDYINECDKYRDTIIELIEELKYDLKYDSKNELHHELHHYDNFNDLLLELSNIPNFRFKGKNKKKYEETFKDIYFLSNDFIFDLSLKTLQLTYKLKGDCYELLDALKYLISDITVIQTLSHSVFFSSISKCF